MSENTHEVTDANFEAEVVNADLPTMVDMWAPWCGPCRMVTPVVEKLAEENADKVKVCKLNVDDNPETAGKFAINAIPSVLFFKDGKEVTDLRMVGVQPQDVYQNAIDKLAGS